MINLVTALESCWHISSPWGEFMPPLAFQVLEKVFLPNSDLSGYCCGAHWEANEWIYAIFCPSQILYLPERELQTTNQMESIHIPTPSLRLGDVVKISFSEQPTQRIIQGIFSLKKDWLYGVEWRSPVMEDVGLSQSRIIWLADVDLVG